MRMPGFAAEAALQPASQTYRLTSAYGRRPYSLAPAQVDLFILEAFPSGEVVDDTGAVISGDLCSEYKKCCKQGFMGCCLDYIKHCI